MLYCSFFNSRLCSMYLARSVCNDNVRSYSIVHVDGLCLPGLPRPGHEGVRLVGERANGTQVDHVAGQLGHEHLLDVGSDLHFVAAARCAQIFATGDLRRKSGQRIQGKELTLWCQGSNLPREADYLTHLVHWMQRVMTVFTRGPKFLSSTARLP